MKKLSLSITLLMTVFGVLKAQSETTLSITTGLAKIPMQEWTDNMQSFASSVYIKDKFASVLGIDVEYHFERYYPQYGAIYMTTLYLKLDRIHYASSLSLTQFERQETIHYEFESYPVSFGYKYFPPIKIPIYISLGVGFYFSSQSTTTYPINSGDSAEYTQTDDGKGYGFEIGIGISPKITERFKLIPELSYRYADGMYFNKEPASTKIEFSGLYFSIKFGYSF